MIAKVPAPMVHSGTGVARRGLPSHAGMRLRRGRPGSLLQRILDKWGLPVLAVVIGSMILWGLFFAPGRPKEDANAPAAAASQ